MKTLIQHASGKEARELLELIEPLHNKRCKKHGWRYVCNKVAHPGDRSGAWTRFALAEENIISDPDGLTVVLDGVDAVWWLDEQLADAFAECGGDWDVGMVQGRRDSGLLNSGAIYLRNTKNSLEFVKRCLAHGEKRAPEKPYPFGSDLVPVDETVTKEAESNLRLARLPIWWNEWPSACGQYHEGKSRETVVRALHGCSVSQKLSGVAWLVNNAPAARKGAK